MFPSGELRHFTLILNVDFSEKMTADLFDRYIWLSIILAKFNLQYHLCSPFLWKMGSFQYVGPGYKACLSKLSQSFFIIFPPDVLSYRTCSASACLCYLFALMIFCLHTYDSGIKSYATKKISISDRSKNRPLWNPGHFLILERWSNSSACEAQHQSIQNSSAATSLGKSTPDEAIFAALNRKRKSKQQQF